MTPRRLRRSEVLRTVATVIGAVFYAAGWVAGRVLWPAVTWSAAAVRLGWNEGRRPLFARGARNWAGGR